MLSDLQVLQRVCAHATCPEDVFGPNVKASYRQFARVTHPDRYAKEPNDVQELAQHTFGLLNAWHTKALAKLEAKTYGDRTVAPAPPPVVSPHVIQTPKRKYFVSVRIAEGDLADLYACSYVNGSSEEHAVFKVTQSAADNDLLENERRVLLKLHAENAVDAAFARYVPHMLDSFLLRSDRVNRRVNVLERADGYVSVTDVRAVHLAGLDFRDAAWIFKRGLAAIGYAHRKGFVHGAVLPPHLMVHPTGHGARLVDWCYAVEANQSIRAISKSYRAFYPPEVIAKRPATSQTDLYMLAKTMVYLLGGERGSKALPDFVPPQIRSFLASCLLEAQGRRPDSAWDLHEEFDELLLRLVGKPTYRPLTM